MLSKKSSKGLATEKKPKVQSKRGRKPKNAVTPIKSITKGIPIVLKFTKSQPIDDDDDFEDNPILNSETTNESDGFELGDEMLDTDEKEHKISHCTKCISLEAQLKICQQEIEQYKVDGVMPNSEPRKLHYNNINFVSADKKNKVILKKTDVWCWWCSHPFDCLPWPLVENCIEQTLSDQGVRLPKPKRVYEIIGNFCSASCAVSHNEIFINDSKKTLRYSLMVKLYREMYDLPQDTPVEIHQAPHWKTLIVKGGDLTIEQFRAKCLAHTEFIVYIPPMKPIQITIEEKSLQQSKGHTIKRTSGLKGMEHLIKR
jgi:hypothetical protein